MTTTTRTALVSYIGFDAIKRDLNALLGRVDELALTVPRHLRPHVESFASDIRYSMETILVPLCEGRQPPMEPRYPAEPMEREDMLDERFPDNRSAAE